MTPGVVVAWAGAVLVAALALAAVALLCVLVGASLTGLINYIGETSVKRKQRSVTWGKR